MKCSIPYCSKQAARTHLARARRAGTAAAYLLPRVYKLSEEARTKAREAGRQRRERMTPEQQAEERRRHSQRTMEWQRRTGRA
jgi:hypothetical protein